MTIIEFIKNPDTKIIDVRSQEEYAGGHIAGSINIPVSEIPQKAEEIKALNAPIVVCCLSGGRSGMAEMMLKQMGVSNVVNGGPWTEVQSVLNN